MKPHDAVTHPRLLLHESRSDLQVYQDFILGWLATQAGSPVAFWACFIIPLIALPASTSVKLIVSVIFSNWYQAWALPAIKRSQDQAQKLADAKVDADHVALTHIANQVDKILEILDRSDKSDSTGQRGL